MKQLLFNKEAREKLSRGADTLAKAVVSTLGPRSRNVASARKGMVPLVMHDGVSVAKSVTPLKDPFENIGAELLKEASSNTNDLVGDGTTTATLLANYLIQEGMKLVNGGTVNGTFGSNINPMEIKEKLSKYTEAIDTKLTALAKKLEDKDIFSIAKISSGSDEIAKIVYDAVKKVGEGGMIMTGPSDTFETYIEHKEGMEFDNGYLSNHFVTNPHKMIVEYDDAYIMLLDETVADYAKLEPILKKVHDQNADKMPVVIIANDVVGQAMQGMVLLKLKGTLPVCAVMAPEYADRRKEMLEDLAVLTGGVVYSPEKGNDVKEMNIKDLGRASVRITATHSLITPKFPDKEELDARAEAIREQIAHEENDFRKDRMKYRLAKITQGVGIIRVGGGSEAEINDKRLRIDDSVHAVRAAISEGAVIGGEMTLRNLALGNIGEGIDNGVIDELVGNALCAPFETLMKNSGIDPSVALDEITKSKGKANVYDVVNRKAVDAFDSGIIDPVKVTKLVVRHAFSVAGMFLTTDTLIVDEPETDVQKMRIVNENN